MADWLGLKDKVVVVTGAVGGMGTHFAKPLQSMGRSLSWLILRKMRFRQQLRS